MFSGTVAHPGHPRVHLGPTIDSPNITKHFVSRYFGCLESRAPKSLTKSELTSLPSQETTEAILETVWQEHVPIQSLPVFFGLTGLPEKSCAFFANQTPGGWDQPLWDSWHVALPLWPRGLSGRRVVTQVGENTGKCTQNTNSNLQMTKSPFPQNRPPKKQEQTPASFCEYIFRSILLKHNL